MDAAQEGLSLQSATKKEITGRRCSIYLRDVNARNPVVERLKENVRRIVAASTEVVSLVTGFQVGVCVVANENLLVCIGDSLSEEQIAHIDFDDRQYQAVVFLTSRTPSTLVDKCACRSVDADDHSQMQRLLHTCEIIPECLRSKVKGYADALLHCQYSQCLAPAIPTDDVQFGTVLITRGGVLHAGPASAGWRIGLFFSIAPGQIENSYDGNTQYNRFVVLDDLRQDAWTALNSNKTTSKDEECTEQLVRDLEKATRWCAIDYAMTNVHSHCKYEPWMQIPSPSPWKNPGYATHLMDAKDKYNYSFYEHVKNDTQAVTDGAPH